MGISSMDICFHTKQYGDGRKTYNSEVHYYGKLEKIIELQYHRSQDTLILYKYDWYIPIEKLITMVW